PRGRGPGHPLRLRRRHVAPLRRDRGHDDRRPGRGHQLRPAQDRRAGPLRPRGQVQPAAPDRGRSRRGGRLPRWRRPRPAETGMNVRKTWLLVGSLATVVLLFIAVFPARTYLDQRRTRQETLTRIHATEATNRRLEQRIQVLHTDAEVERLARAQYNLVRPCEEAYAIL